MQEYRCLLLSKLNAKLKKHPRSSPCKRFVLLFGLASIVVIIPRRRFTFRGSGGAQAVS